jgi:glycosyltransferase involved in cell wall biosynthesis
MSPEWSGSARATATLARGLSARGHSVTVACPADSPLEQHLERGAYEVLETRGAGTVAGAAGHLRRALQERFVQVVCVHCDREQVVAATAARLAGRAAILRRVSAGQKLVPSSGARVALRFATTGFVFTSEQDARSAPPLPLARLMPVVSPLGVRVAAYDSVRPASRSLAGTGTGTRILVCIHDGSARVRAGNVLRVVALLAKRHPELRLIFLGPGSADADLKVHAAALRISRAVSFLGERDDYLSVLALADLGWVVSGGDDGAYALLDLMGSRVPVIAERGTLAEQYVPDGIAGIVLPPGDAHDTAASVARLLAHDDERIAMGAAANARVAREFTEEGMVDSFERAAVAASDRSVW